MATSEKYLSELVHPAIYDSFGKLKRIYSIFLLPITKPSAQKYIFL